MTSELDKIIQVYALANRLIEQFGLVTQVPPWRFELTSTKNIMGQCDYANKVIEYSKYYLNVPMYEIEDTIRHEIAHALAGYRNGHNHVWRRTALACGAKPTRTAPPEVKSSAKPNYVIKCSACNKVLARRYRLRANQLSRHVSNCCNAKLDFYKVVNK